MPGLMTRAAETACMADIPWIGINDQQFARIATIYRQRYPVYLWACTTTGQMVFRATGSTGRGQTCDLDRGRLQALEEGRRWGEPSLYDCPCGLIFWGLPLMYNNQVVGGLVAAAAAEELFNDDGEFLVDLPRACSELREIAEGENVTNAALLQRLREQHLREQRRAEAIHDAKARYAGDVMEAYLREEPALMTAIRQGRRPEAVAILNRILTLLYGYAGERLDLIKSLMLELVVTMSRSAVLAGGSPNELLGSRYDDLALLGGIDDEEELSRWLVQMLQRIMNSVGRGTGDVALQKLQQALAYLGEYLGEDVSRDMVARHVDLSPAHFSRLLKEKTGLSFTEQLTQLRVNRAIDYLVAKDRSVLDIALTCGFSDQSYFTRVFRKATGLTPAAYRKAHAHVHSAG